MCRFQSGEIRILNADPPVQSKLTEPDYGGFMKTSLATALWTVSLSAQAQMMNDGVWGSDWMGGHGGIWVPILIAIAVVGGVAWAAKQKGK